jgi:hypothetical protein
MACSDESEGSRAALLGKSMTGSPFQSFQERVTTGITGGFPVNATSNMARLMSLPGLARWSDVFTRSNCATSIAFAIVSSEAAAKKYTYSR